MVIEVNAMFDICTPALDRRLYCGPPPVNINHTIILMNKFIKVCASFSEHHKYMTKHSQIMLRQYRLYMYHRKLSF